MFLQKAIIESLLSAIGVLLFFLVAFRLQPGRRYNPRNGTLVLAAVTPVFVSAFNPGGILMPAIILDRNPDDEKNRFGYWIGALSLAGSVISLVIFSGAIPEFDQRALVASVLSITATALGVSIGRNDISVRPGRRHSR